MENLKRFYSRLGIQPGASLEEIRQAYADAERGFHAERLADDPQVRRKAQEQLSALNEAYLALVDAYEVVQASLGDYRDQPVPPPGQCSAPLPEGALPAGRRREAMQSPFTGAGTTDSEEKERSAAAGDAEVAVIPSPGTDQGDFPDPVRPLKKEIAKLLAVLAAVIVILLAIRYKTHPVQSPPVAPSTFTQIVPSDIRHDAELGNAKAQTLLGYLYRDGKGVRKDLAGAAKWFGRAALQGDAEAQDWFGYLYETGQGVPQDYREAARWYRMAAEQGNADAQKNLGLMYANGKGVAQSSQDAEMWLKKAAAQGNGEAVRTLQMGKR
jgi:hypothetical protein